MRRAVAIASAATSPRGTTRVSKPLACASAASNTRPSSRISSVAARPASASKPCSSPGAIGKPSLLIGTPKRLSVAAIRRSQWQAISSPPPTQTPSMQATVGCRQPAIAASAGASRSTW